MNTQFLRTQQQFMSTQLRFIALINEMVIFLQQIMRTLII